MTYTKTMADVLRLEARSLEMAASMLENTADEAVSKLVTLFQQLQATESALIFVE